MTEYPTNGYPMTPENIEYINEWNTRVYAPQSGGHSSTILDSWSSADVYGENIVGGLVGLNQKLILRSYAEGNVYGLDRVGGLVGTNEEGGVIGDSHAEGDVSVRYEGDDTWRMGGFVGNNRSGAKIFGSYATGNVSGEEGVGGFSGGNGGYIARSYATGNVTATAGEAGGFTARNGGMIVWSHAEGNVSANDWYAGGFVGDGDGGLISHSYATGNVTGLSAVGGFVGRNSGTLITHSYATGNVEGFENIGGFAGGIGEGELVVNSYATGNVTGDAVVGGFTGRLGGTIENVYATGLVTVGESDYFGGLVGRFATGGGSDPHVINSFWDITTTGVSIEENYTGSGTGLATLGMKTAGTFSGAGWDMTDVWSIAPGEYPSLRIAIPDRDDVILYAADGAGSNSYPTNLYLVDHNTGFLYDIIGEIGEYHITGMAFHPETDELYASSGSQGPYGRRLFLIDRETGEAELLGLLLDEEDNEHNLADIAFRSDGTLFGWSERGDDLYTVDLDSCDGDTCLVVKVGESDLDTAGSGLAFSSNGTLFFFGNSEYEYYTINPTTGAVTGTFEFTHDNNQDESLNAAALGPDGNVYVSRRSTDFVRLNHSTNALETLFGYQNDRNWSYIDAIAFYGVWDVGGSEDETSPTAPSNLHDTGFTVSSVSLAWTAATDDTGVAGYNVYRNGILVGTTTLTTFIVTGLTQGTAYEFVVRAFDDAENLSGPSNTHTVRTDGAPITHLNTGGSGGGGGGGGGGWPIVSPTSYTGTQPTGTLQDQINALIAQLMALIAQAQLQGVPLPPGLGQGLQTTTGVRDLTMGDVGEDVRALQNFLMRQNKGSAARALAGIGATGYFGTYTRDALAEYQLQAGIRPAIVYFGSITRVYLTGQGLYPW